MTKLNSECITGKNKEFSVSFKGELVKLWITEVEKLFGLCPHYTDYGDLGMGDRRRLLGLAWCVESIKSLLSPLKQYYICNSIN